MDRILVADDNTEITDLIENILEKEGYEIIKTYSGLEAVDAFDHTISLVILDVMMPEMDGFEVCQKIRQKSQVPILFLSAKGTDIDKVVGLSAGGDDYMVKPFSAIELVARVRALIRRYHYAAKTPQSGNVITVNEVLTVDLDARKVTKYGEEITLTRTEFGILELLAKNKGKVFSTEMIFKSVWQEKYYEGNNTVMVHLARLREKIEDNPKKAQIIKNVWGVGYKIEE
ncbi:response regulator transcription factor [Anaerosporobacter faecicola]|uniref:response regulator transcription factor n=1 Tax=Anaerosporobacter faecicola TaxID=2718714 RepID=UPI001438B5AA|nr:response regulator transcription factor [Anaerosporobacter faecicola]